MNRNKIGTSPSTRGAATVAIVVIVLLIVALGGAAVYALQNRGGGGDISAEGVIEAMGEINSLKSRTAITGEITAPTIPLAFGTATEEATETATTAFTVNVESAADETDKENIKQESSVTVTITPPESMAAGMGISGPITLSFDSRSIGTTSYFRLTDAPTIGFISLEPFEGQWISLSQEAMLSQNPAVEAEELENLQGQLAALEDEFIAFLNELVAINEETPIATFEAIGSESIEGIPSQGFSFTLETETAPEFIEKALVAFEETFGEAVREMNGQFGAEEIPEGAFTLSAEEKAMLESALENAEVAGSLYISKKTLHPTRFSVETNFASPESSTSGIVSIETTMYAFNEPVAVEAPAESQPFQEFMGGLFPVFSAGGMPMQ